jgi:hypothetical protein
VEGWLEKFLSHHDETALNRLRDHLKADVAPQAIQDLDGLVSSTEGPAARRQRRVGEGLVSSSSRAPAK